MRMKYPADPTLKIWELNDLLSPEDKRIIYDRGIEILREWFWIKGQR
jgi:hypothetical protein